MTSRSPLSGRSVLVTRPSHQAEPLVRLLAEAGASVECVPTIRLCDPEDRRPLLEAAANLGRYDWAVFTSVNGVERFQSALDQQGVDPTRPGDLRWAAIGPATARAIHRLGVPVVLIPSSYRAEALAEAICEAVESESGGDRPLAGRRVLLARAGGARAVLPERLRALGADVDEVVAYVTEPNLEAASSLRSPAGEERWDWITFTASSAVRAFGELGGDVGDSRVAVIGPITARTAQHLGFPVDAVATEYTVPGLVRAIEEAEA